MVIALSVFGGFLLGMFITVMLSIAKRSELIEKNNRLRNLLQKYKETYGSLEVHKRKNNRND